MAINELIIIGAGLIGSSIAIDVKNKNLAHKITLISRNPTQKEQESLHLISNQILENIDDYFLSLSKESNSISQLPSIIIIATPISAYKSIITNIGQYQNLITQHNIIISDVGSVKSYPTRLMLKHLDIQHIVATHPIAGSDKSGTCSGTANLFLNKKIIITKIIKEHVAKDLQRNNIQIIEKFWQQLGSETIIMDANTHDNIFALTSHLIQFCAFQYNTLLHNILDADTINKIVTNNHDNIPLQKFLRLTGSNITMWNDIFFHNIEYLTFFLDKFQQKLSHIFKLIEAENTTELAKLVNRSITTRKEIAAQKIGENSHLNVNHHFAVENYNLIKIIPIIITTAILQIEELSANISDFIGSGFLDFTYIINSYTKSDLKHIIDHKNNLLHLYTNFQNIKYSL